MVARQSTGSRRTVEQVASEVARLNSPRGSAGRSRRLGPPGRCLGLVPCILFLGVFFLFPVASLLRRSLFDPSYTLEHYAQLLREPVYLHILWVPFKISVVVTLFTILLGYPFAYSIYKVRGRWKLALLGFVLLPFWTSLLTRTFAFMLLLQSNGVVNRILLGFHLVSQPLPLVYTLTGVLVGMCYMLLPYMVLPLYG